MLLSLELQVLYNFIAIITTGTVSISIISNRISTTNATVSYNISVISIITIVCDFLHRWESTPH